ncbi:MAG: hypothetical protein K2M87_01530 [Muribaculaceae bacterium]|nr:hypothetical protein [Muribaculaceae bacterium]
MLKLLNSEKIIAEATEYCKSLPDSKQKVLKESLCNGRALLRSSDQMKAYLYHYGNIHRQKLLKAYSKLPEYIFSRNFSVIDWGCGQGLGSIVLDEFIEEEKEVKNIITDITLIEPSIHCLRQAIGYVQWTLPKAMLTAISKKEDNISNDDICLQESSVVHILSNIVDMPEFSGKGLKEILASSPTYRHVIVMVSPFYPEEGRGKRMDEFCDSLERFQNVYSFQKHIDEWKEDYSCQIRIMDNCKK